MSYGGADEAERLRAILPEPGERPEFGKHRQDPRDAETAPAWPSLSEVELRRERSRGLRKGD
jgi:hypothetical protein